MKKFTEQAKDYFDRHPSSEECHITSDGRVFHSRGGAEGFSGTLENREIESYNRKTFEKNDDVSNQQLSEEQKAELLATDIETAKYDVLKNIVKVFDIKTADQKAETLKAAITEFKNLLQKPTE